MNDGRAVLIMNPLKFTLAHYELELIETLSFDGQRTVKLVNTVPGDGITGPQERILVAARSMLERIQMARLFRRRTIIVLWPLFGYLEPFTLIALARRNTVYVVVHDPVPLRRAYGQSHWARSLFKVVTDRWGIQVLYHTVSAQRVGIRENGVKGVVVPHPILETTRVGAPLGDTTARPVIRVLGQYKHTRSVEPLIAIADRANSSLKLEIHGRGWPDVPGWTVASAFIPEDEFSELIATSDCVVIPYDLFFQSGVAVRCMEAGVPVVAPEHEHIAQLYGDEWAGIVGPDSDWYDAVVRALAIDPAILRSRNLGVSQHIRRAWNELLSMDL